MRFTSTDLTLLELQIASISCCILLLVLLPLNVCHGKFLQQPFIRQVQEGEKSLREVHESETTAKLQEKEGAALSERRRLEKQIASLAEQLKLLQQKLQDAEEASFPS